MGRTEAVILVLCGWAGSQEKHLRIYESLLRRILSETCKTTQVECIRCSLPLHLIFSPVESHRTAWVREKVLRPLVECFGRLKDSSNVAVLVQAFSNGGGFVVEQLYKLYGVHEEPSDLDVQARDGEKRVLPLPPVKGIVFDSAPGYDRGEMGKRVLEEVLGTSRWYQRAVINILHGSQRIAARILNGSRQKEYWKLMIDIGDWCPTLHLYSMDDHLCDPDRLYELIMVKVGRGMDVQHRCWDVSAHCGHYKLHKGAYEEAVSSFVARALGEGGQTGSKRPYAKL